MSAGGVVILGARSWIGFRLAEAFAEHGVPVLGTTSSVSGESPPAAADMPRLEVAAAPSAFEALIRRRRPAVVFNLLRGENSAGLEIHAKMARLCSDLGARYIYASSALVFEGHAPGLALDEQATPTASTPYGSFKAACEHLLASEHPRGDWQVLRFASIQGWSPWKPSRNESFLRRLAKGERVDVNIGIVQNRMLDRDFARQVRDNVLLPSARGFMHLGTVDASEEVDFLRRVAIAFGWSPGLVLPGAPKSCHIALDCAATHALTGGRWRRTEAETIQGLLGEPGLSPLLSKPR